jgi:hypothetical protein
MPPVEAIDDSGGDGPPLMLSVAIDCVPGNDLDRVGQVVAALDQAYAELREAVIHQRSGVAKDVVRAFWLAHFGRAFRCVAAVQVMEPE